MKDVPVVQKGLKLVALFALLITLGCSAKEESKPKDEKADQTAATQIGPRVLSDVEQKLVGVWLGGASLDEQLVEKQFELQPDQQKQIEFVDQAEAFLSTVMAIQFNSDGTYEQDIEQTMAGQRQIGKGTWRVNQVQDSKLIVSTIETDPDGKVVEAKRTFRFYPDGNRFAMVAPVNEQLSKCDAVLVFSRQANLESERTAESQGSEVSR